LDLHTLQAKFEEHKQHSAQQGHQRKRPKRTNPGQSDLTEGWTLCETWKTCPLGMLPPNKVPDLQFPSEFDKMCGGMYPTTSSPPRSLTLSPFGATTSSSISCAEETAATTYPPTTRSCPWRWRAW